MSISPGNIFLIFLACLLALPVSADIRTERTHVVYETVTEDRVCLGLLIKRVDYYTERRGERDLDSTVVSVYQADTERLIIRDRLRGDAPEVCIDTLGLWDMWDIRMMLDDSVKIDEIDKDVILW